MDHQGFEDFEMGLPPNEEEEEEEDDDEVIVMGEVIGPYGTVRVPEPFNPELYGNARDYPDLPSPEYAEWQYVHRRTSQEIIPGLFLGPYASATLSALPTLQAQGITHIVCVRQEGERRFIRANHEQHFKYLILEMIDSPDERIINHVKKCNEFLDEALEGGGRVLVHGNGGIARAPALVIGYIMWRFGTTASNALQYVQQKRFCINLSDEYMKQLHEFEPIYRAIHNVPLSLPGETPCGLKRDREPDDDEDDTDIGLIPESANKAPRMEI